MRKFRFLLATLLLVAIPLGVNAEEKLIKTNFKVRKNNINYILCPDNKEFPGAQLNANNSYADIQVFDFGEEGTTIIIKESRIPSPIQISIIASVLRPNVPNTPILSVDQPPN